MNKEQVILAANRIEYLVEAMITLLESKHVEILIPAYYQSTINNIEKNYNIVRDYLCSNNNDLYLEYEDPLESAFSEGPDEDDWVDAFCTYSDYVDDLKNGVDALREITKRMWPTSYSVE